VLPTTVSVPHSSSHIPGETPRFDQRQNSVPLSDIEQPRKSGDNNESPHGIDTRAGGRRWIDRLADTLPPTSSSSHGFSQKGWEPGVKTRLTIGIGIMWIANILWAH
jgi:hypothetical protein